MRSFGRRPRTSKTCPGVTNRSSGMSSIFFPPGSKWNGASTWVPVWLMKNNDSARNPCTSRVVHGVKVGDGYTGNIWVLGPIGRERSTTRRKEIGRMRTAPRRIEGAERSSPFSTKRYYYTRQPVLYGLVSLQGEHDRLAT